MYRRPLWRLVRAENRIHTCGGTFHEGKEGGEFSFEPTGKFSVSSFNPGKVHSGIDQIPMYTCGPGWILERWMPPHVWGTRDDWNQTKAADGQRLFGEYPSEGDYWMLEGPFCDDNEVPLLDPPPLTFLLKTIEVYEHCRNNQNQSFEAIYARDIAREKMEAEMKYLRMMDEILACGREVESVLKSGSLAAQRVRQHAAKMRGDRSHQAL